MGDYPVTVRFPLHWGELDALGHANNARYFVWFESARIALFQKIGLQTAAPAGLGPILATTRCDFLRPVTFPAELIVGTRITRLGTTSFEMEYAVSCADTPEEHLARGSSVVVLVDYEKMQKAPLPAELRKAIEAL